MSNLEILFASGLNLLDELDRSLPHGSDDEWDPAVSARRNLLVWQVAQDAVNAGYAAHVSREVTWPVVFIELPTGQVSWHVPTSIRPEGVELRTSDLDSEDLWDQHTREDKAKRITDYLAGVHFQKGA